MRLRSMIAYVVAVLVVACAGCRSKEPEAANAHDLQRLAVQAVSATGDLEARAAADQLREAVFQSTGVEIRHERPVRTLPMDAASSEALRKALVEGQHPVVRAQAAKTLGEMMDVDNAEPLLAAMKGDDSLDVRRESYEAMRLILGGRFHGYGPEDPPERRAEAVEKNREFLEDMKKHPMVEVIRDPRKRAAYDQQVIERYHKMMEQQQGSQPTPNQITQ